MPARRRPGGRPARWRRRLTRSLLALPALLTGLVAAGGLLLFLSLPRIPDPRAELAGRDLPRVTFLAADGRVLAERGGRGPTHLRLGEISPYLVAAVLAVEDRDFFRHPGIDPRGLLRALWRVVREGDYVAGGSTITQQLAKNLFTGGERTLLRKLRELAAAVRLELALSKEEILELYLDRVYFGAGAWGAEAAARTYFGKSAADLDLLEAAVLAGLLRAPARLSPLRDPEAARARARVVLRAMVATGAIDEAAARAALARPLRLAPVPAFARHFLDRAAREVDARLGPPTADRVVHTALRPALQRRVEAALARALAVRPGLEGAVVVLDRQGLLRALAVSHPRRSARDRTAMPRPPGSAFKPFVYAAALEAGMTPATVVDDRPVTVEGWSPRNWDGRFRGPVTLTRAFALSLNTAAVRLQERVGRDRVIALARAAGITAPLAPLPSLALGTQPVTPLELTRAVGALLTGRRLPATAVVRVDDGAGRVLATAPLPGARVVTPATAAALERLFVAAVREGTARAAAVPGAVVGAKTGTGTGGRDGWMVGFAGDLLIGVWVGRDDARPVPGLAGGTLPARIFRDVARAAVARRAAALTPSPPRPRPPARRG